jgi:hypothetical protein
LQKIGLESSLGAELIFYMGLALVGMARLGDLIAVASPNRLQKAVTSKRIGVMRFKVDSQVF